MRIETDVPTGAFKFHKLKDHFVTYAAYPGETPIISGGKMRVESVFQEILIPTGWIWFMGILFPQTMYRTAAASAFALIIPVIQSCRIMR